MCPENRKLIKVGFQLFDQLIMTVINQYTQVQGSFVCDRVVKYKFTLIVTKLRVLSFKSKDCAPLTHQELSSDNLFSWGRRGKHVHETLNSIWVSPFHEKIGAMSLAFLRSCILYLLWNEQYHHFNFTLLTPSLFK